MRWGFIVLLAGCVGAAPTAAIAENPIQLFQRMIAPEIKALRGGFPLPKAPRVAKAATAAALVSVPMPRLRPASANAVPVLGFLPNTATIAIPTDELRMPAPRLRPAVPDMPLLSLVMPEVKSPAPTLASLPELIKPPPAAQSTCGVSLVHLGVVAKPLEAIEDGECGMTAPVEVAALDGGAIGMGGKPVVNCAVAETLADWMENTVEPMATRMLGGKVKNLRIVAGYDCRNRNGLADAKLSEHGRGNAVDIAAFEVEGRGWVTIGAASGEEDAFLSAIRKSACGPFKTVLGPGSDAYHSDHFHLDLAQRRNGGKYCR